MGSFYAYQTSPVLTFWEKSEFGVVQIIGTDEVRTSGGLNVC